MTESPKKAVLLLFDSLRPDRLSCYGFPEAVSPNLDSLAREGALFRTALAPATFTLSSHRSLFSSRCILGHNYTLADPRVKTLPEILSGNSVLTGAILSNAVTGKFSGLAEGFVHFDDRRLLPGKLGKLKLKNAGQVADASIHFMEEHARESFFLFAQFMDTHRPYTYPEIEDSPFLEKEDLSTLPGILQRNERSIRYADREAGRIFAKARELGIEKDTLFIVCSDHGESLGERGLVCRHGQHFFEEQLRVPLLMKGPGIPAGKKVGGLASLLDLAPTLLEHFSFPVPDDFEGRSLFPAARKGMAEERAYFRMNPLAPFRWGEKELLYGVRTSRWKLVKQKKVKEKMGPIEIRNRLLLLVQLARSLGPVKALLQLARALKTSLFRLRHRKRMRAFAQSSLLFFDLEADPREERNLAIPPSKELTALETALESWMNGQKIAGTDRERVLSPEFGEQLKGLGYL